jgi:hypothetical protein
MYCTADTIWVQLGLLPQTLLHKIHRGANKKLEFLEHPFRCSHNFIFFFSGAKFVELHLFGRKIWSEAKKNMEVSSPKQALNKHRAIVASR